MAFWLLLTGLSEAAVAPVADCKPCGIALDIPRDELWQGLQREDKTTFVMQRGNELFATIEILKFYNEARYSLDQLAKNYREICGPDIVIEGAFVSRKINGIPVRWGRGRGISADGGKFLVQLLFFFNGEDACQLITIVREQSKSLHENLMPEIINSIRPLPALMDD